MLVAIDARVILDGVVTDVREVGRVVAACDEKKYSFSA